MHIGRVYGWRWVGLVSEGGMVGLGVHIGRFRGGDG